ncbi:MAG: DUF3791 domain-containing protein [Clostridiales Family XIII bacterium]|nr:DUF3791 domain-containing protein [Clostridiales Family XIII bacterium]
MLLLFRRRLCLTWDELDILQQNYKLSDFLLAQYELLHYYDNDYIIEDILRYIRDQGGDIRDIQRAG